MSSERRKELFRRLLAVASEETPPAAGPHFVDDDELLDRWSGGELDAAHHNQCLDHLDHCSYCRSVVARLVREKLLTLTESGVDTTTSIAWPGAAAPLTEPVSGPMARPGAMAGNRGRRLWTVAAAAALVGIAFLLFATGRRDNHIAMAERELDANQPAAALSRLEELQRKKMPPADTARAKKLAEQAGYLLAKNSLGTKDFAGAQQAVDRATQIGADSAELTNLQLQADRRLSDESSMRRGNTLLDYQYDISGIAPTKSMPVLDDQTSRIQAAFSAAVTRFATNPQLRLNFGHFLLSFRKLPEAQQQFAAARDLAPSNAEAYLGLGLAAFEQESFDEAARWFTKAAELDPQGLDAHLNAAMCLDRLQRTNEASPHWELAETLAVGQRKEVIAAHRRGR